MLLLHFFHLAVLPKLLNSLPKFLLGLTYLAFLIRARVIVTTAVFLESLPIFLTWLWILVILGVVQELVESSLNYWPRFLLGELPDLHLYLPLDCLLLALHLPRVLLLHVGLQALADECGH